VDEFPVMLKAEDICGRRLGLCQYGDIDTDLAAWSSCLVGSPTKRTPARLACS